MTILVVIQNSFWNLYCVCDPISPWQRSALPKLFYSYYYYYYYHYQWNVNFS